MGSRTESSPLLLWRECFVFKQIRMLVPVGFKTEIKELCSLAGPVTMSQFMVYAVSFVSTVFCGHLGKTELAGVSLAIAVINITGVSIGIGLAAACDTLISQTVGGGNLTGVGVIMQKAILILLLACFPCWAILINTESILLAVRQEPEVARLAQLYVKIFMPALPATFMYALQARYLQNQGIIWPQVVTGIVVNIFNALINYIFLNVLNLGVAFTYVTDGPLRLQGQVGKWVPFKSSAPPPPSLPPLSKFPPCNVCCYVIPRAEGWSKVCLQDWGSYINLAIPSMVMLCVEWWSFEIGSFLAGLISEVELGAQAVIYQLASLAFMFPFGFSIAGNVRVGNALGAGDTEQAKLSAKITMFCAASVSVCSAVLIGGLKDHISYVFTYDEQIRERVSDVISLFAPFVLLDAMSTVSGGIIRGAGKQKVGALCYILGNYGVGLPIGITLMFAAKLGIKGLWTGMFVCMSLQSTFLVYYLVRMNWSQVTIEAQIRAGVYASVTDPSLQPDDAGSPEGHIDTLDLVEEEAGPEVRTGDGNLSHRTLVLRRGLALAVMLFILAAGIILNLLVKNLVK